MYYKDAVGVFVVFDVTRLSTFEAVQMWKADLDNKVRLPNGAPIPAVLLANKVCIVINRIQHMIQFNVRNRHSTNSDNVYIWSD